jgi:hypothetical protein
MESERRTAPRKRASELPFIQFGEETGGIVWNVSEQGLGFQTVAPLRESGVVRLCISPNPKKQIEILGTVVWTDESKRSGGLRFTELCPESRELVRSWLTEPQVPEIGGQDCTSAGPATGETVSPCSAAEGHGAGALSFDKVPRDLLVADVRSGITTIPPLNAHSRRACVQTSASRSRFSPGSGWRRMHTVLTGFIIGVVVLAPMVLLTSSRREIGSLLIRLGEKLKGKNNMQADPYLSSPAPNSGPNPSEVQLNGKSPSAGTPDKPVPFATVQNMSGDPAAPAAASPRGDPLSHQIPNPHSAKRGSSLARELWSEIGAGNIAAEVALAELYLRGEGVPRNCEQARVLLRAAAKSGDFQAAQDLRSLRTNGCR